MENKIFEETLKVTKLDSNEEAVKSDCLKLDVSKELINGLNLLVKSVTGEDGNAFLLELPEGLSGALSKVVFTTLGEGASWAAGTPWADIITLALIATCKYFFSIYNQLEDINNKLTAVIDFLVTNKLCELESQLKFLEFSYNNYEYIVTNEGERLATIFQIQSTKKIALQNILFYERYLSRHLYKTANTKNALIDEARVFLENAENYRYSAELYCLSLVMELIFSQNYNKNLISNVKKEISGITKDVNKNLFESVGAMKKALNSKNFNKDSENKIVEKINKYSDMSEREAEYSKILDELLERVNSHTKLIIKDNALYIK